VGENTSPGTIRVETFSWGPAPTVEGAYYYASQNFLLVYLCLDSGNPELNKWPEISPQGFRDDEEPVNWCLFLRPTYPDRHRGRGMTEVKIIPEGLERFLGSDLMFLEQGDYTIMILILANEHQREMAHLLLQNRAEVKRKYGRKS